ncbi:unnamed protein product [Musa acuminata subsp. burmannicoides]
MRACMRAASRGGAHEWAGGSARPPSGLRAGGGGLRRHWPSRRRCWSPLSWMRPTEKLNPQYKHNRMRILYSVPRPEVPPTTVPRAAGEPRPTHKRTTRSVGLAQPPPGTARRRRTPDLLTSLQAGWGPGSTSKGGPSRWERCRMGTPRGGAGLPTAGGVSSSRTRPKRGWWWWWSRSSRLGWLRPIGGGTSM